MARVAACLLALSVMLAGAAEASGAVQAKSPLKQACEAKVAAALVQDTLDNAAWGKGSLRLKEWMLLPAGYAFCIPDGFSLHGRNNGDTITLVDDMQQDARNRTIISIHCDTKAGSEELSDISKEQIQQAYTASFRRFKLKDFSTVDMMDGEGLRIVFGAYDNGPLVIVQMIFNMEGNRYYLTLTMEDTFESVSRGLHCFTALTDSFLFCAAE